jgi:hypothetical protein
MVHNTGMQCGVAQGSVPSLSCATGKATLTGTIMTAAVVTNLHQLMQCQIMAIRIIQRLFNKSGSLGHTN